MQRAVSSVLGVLLLAALTLTLAAVTGMAVITTAPTADAPEPVVISASATVDGDAGTVQLVLVHETGPDLDVRRIEVLISVDGTRLEHQPPVPFYSASGYGSFPSGPFNPATDPQWERGERAGLVVTGENAAPIQPGTAVRVELYRDGLPIAAVETTAN